MSILGCQFPLRCPCTDCGYVYMQSEVLDHISEEMHAKYEKFADRYDSAQNSGFSTAGSNCVEANSICSDASSYCSDENSGIYSCSSSYCSSPRSAASLTPLKLNEVSSKRDFSMKKAPSRFNLQPMLNKGVEKTSRTKCGFDRVELRSRLEVRIQSLVSKIHYLYENPNTVNDHKCQVLEEALNTISLIAQWKQDLLEELDRHDYEKAANKTRFSKNFSIPELNFQDMDYRSDYVLTRC